MGALQFDKNGKLIIPEPSRPLDEDNIVFKCNWNDGGWKGTCSKKAREFNTNNFSDEISIFILSENAIANFCK